MADIRKPVPYALAGDLVARITADQEPGLANAMDTEALEGDVDHPVAVRLLEKLAPVFLAGAENEMTIVQNAPPGKTGLYCTRSS